MVDSICGFLIKQMRSQMPEIDDERAEVIKYGLENLIGELPKAFFMFVLATILGVLDLTVISFFSIVVYRAFSGGFHAKTHIACMIWTNLLYIGNVFLSKVIVYEQEFIKYFLIFAVWAFSMLMIKLYAPADTENVPILSKKDRKQKRILSYITMTMTLIVALFIEDRVISNIIVFGILLQTLTITRIAYKITNNKYGHEVYAQENF